MTARRLSADRDPAQPADGGEVTITLDGVAYQGRRGQTIAGVLLGADVVSWRTTSSRHTARGLFCGIGVCFDCLVEVDGVRDVRACQRRAVDGAAVRRQHDELPLPADEQGDR